LSWIVFAFFAKRVFFSSGKEACRMRSFVLGYVTIAITLGVSVGCVTTHKTTGFQTNPDVNTNLKPSIGAASNEKKSGIKKFFSSFTDKKNSTQRVDPNDPTSLQNRPDVSTELLLVAGKLSLEKHAWESAESYFTRVLKIEPNNALAEDGLRQVAKARAMGLPSNLNSDANPNNQIKTGSELNQALQNLLPKNKPVNNTLGSNSTPLKQRRTAGANAADGKRTIMASYSAAKADLPERDYPSTHSPAPFVRAEPAIEIRHRPRGAKVVNPFYRQDPVMTVAYEEEISSDEPNLTQHDTNDVAATNPAPSSSSDLSRLKESLSKLTRGNSPKRNLNDQDASPVKDNQAAIDSMQPTYKRSVVRLATVPDKLVIGETKIKSIRDSEKIADTQLETVKVVKVIAEDLSSRRGN